MIYVLAPTLERCRSAGDWALSRGLRDKMLYAVLPGDRHLRGHRLQRGDAIVSEGVPAWHEIPFGFVPVTGGLCLRQCASEWGQDYYHYEYRPDLTQPPTDPTALAEWLIERAAERA